LDASGGTTLAADAVRLAVTAAAPATGDFSGDGFVDAVDYTIWRGALGITAARGMAPDANGDTTIDELDYLWWKDQYGATSPAVLTQSAIQVGDSNQHEGSLLLAGLGEHSTPPDPQRLRFESMQPLMSDWAISETPLFPARDMAFEAFGVEEQAAPRKNRQLLGEPPSRFSIMLFDATQLQQTTNVELNEFSGP
ncbi:MAG: dockerin type I domain-containing protein, partial [Aeoliella sp.]